MRRTHRSFPLLLAAASLTVGLAACGGDDAKTDTAATSGSTPTAPGAVNANGTELDAPVAYTKNTTRINAADPSAVAALTALTMYPSTAKDLRPDAVAFAGYEGLALDPAGLLVCGQAARLPAPAARRPRSRTVSQAALAQLQPAAPRS